MDWLADEKIVKNLICLIIVVAFATALIISAIRGKIRDLF